MDEQRLERLSYITKMVPISLIQVQDLARRDFFPKGVIVRIGRRIFVNPKKFHEFLESGGAQWDGGWKRKKAES